MTIFKFSLKSIFLPFYKKIGSQAGVLLCEKLISLAGALVLLIAFLFCSFSSIADNHPRTDAELEQEERLTRDGWKRDDKIRKEEAEQREKENKARARAEEHKARIENRKEQERARKEAIKEMEEKCEQAAKDAEEHIKDKKEEAQDWEEKIHEGNEDIAKLEESLSQKQIEIKEQIDSLKNNSNQTVQELKDDMDREMNQIDSQVASLEKEIDDLISQLEKIEDTRLTAQFARKKLQNERYMACFNQALTKTEEKRAIFYAKKRTKRVKRKTMGELITGGKQQNKSVFSGHFNNHLNLCLNNEVALLQKQGDKDDFKVQSELQARQEERIDQKITKARAQIKNLHTTDKAKVVAKFKEKLEGQLTNFKRNYDTLSASYQTSSQNTHKQIEQIKKQQASYMQNRAQAVPQKTRGVLMNEKCSQQDMFNLFDNPNSGRGLFNSSRRQAIYADPDISGGVK